MERLASIVVGVDFTDTCTSALTEAIRIAEWNRAAVHPVHIIDTLVAVDLQEALSTYQQNIQEDLVADARKHWARFAAVIPGAEQLQLDVRVDNRVRGVLNAAQHAKANLIVLGAYSKREPEVGLGTIATGCVRHAESDVLLVRDDHKGPYKTVVACVDFSPISLQALDDAARIATQDDAALHILHVFDPPWRRLHYRSPTHEAQPQFQRDYRGKLLERLRSFTSGMGRSIEYLKPTYALHDFSGHRSGIADYAQNVGANLIVLGTKGRSNLRDLLLGSTAEKALRDSPCSIWAVRPA